MNERLRKALSLQCKDMGLDSKSIDELTENASSLLDEVGKGLTDNSTDDEVENAAKLFVRFGKGSQAFMTRKLAQKNQPSKKQSDDEGESEGENNTQNQPQGGSDNAALNEILKRISKLENENKNLREERTKAERRAVLKAELKEQGINDFFGDYIAVPEGEDVKEFITKFKQGYISANLPAKGESHEQGGNSLEKRKQEAEEWVKRNFKVD